LSWILIIYAQFEILYFITRINPPTPGPGVPADEKKKNLGHIIKIIGPVLHAAFPPGITNKLARNGQCIEMRVG